MPGFLTRSHPGMVCSTETATVTETLPKEMNKEWEWFRFSPSIKPHFIPDGHGAYELVIEVRCCSAYCYTKVFGWIGNTHTSSLRPLTGSVSITQR